MIPRYDSGAISPAAAGLAPLQTPMLQVLRRGERGSQVCLLAELGSCASCWATRLCHAGPGRDTRVSGGVNDNLPLSPFPSSTAEAIHEVGHCRTGEPASNRLALMATLNASLAEYLASSPVVRVSGRSSRTTAGQEWACPKPVRPFRDFPACGHLFGNADNASAAAVRWVNGPSTF